MENKQHKTITSYAKEHGVPIMKEEGMRFLLAYLKEHPEINKILEVGTAIGYSAIQMAGVRDNIYVDTIEIVEDNVKLARDNIAAYGLSDRIHVYHMDAMEYQTFQYYDFYFIDAAKSQYAHYLEHFLPTSYVGSVFLFDNLNFHGIVDDESKSHNRSTLQMTRKIKKFRDKIQKDPRFETTFYPEIGDGILIAKRILE